MKETTLRNGKVLVIREAVKTDAQSLIEYIDMVAGESDFLTFGRGEFGITLEMEEKILENAKNQKNALFIVAELDDKIVGNLGFTGGTRQRLEHTGEFGVSVLKEFWGCGIGKELIKYLIDWSKNTGIVRKINLRVREDHLKGIKLYKALGFIEEGRKSREFLADGKFYDAILIGLEIDN